MDALIATILSHPHQVALAAVAVFLAIRGAVGALPRPRTSSTTPPEAA